MSVPAKPLRADAARNRARVLETAYDTFAAEGLSVPIDEIARRAGVGAGTVYRHFPTKPVASPSSPGPTPASDSRPRPRSPPRARTSCSRCATSTRARTPNS